MRILLTGATGYIGKRLLPILVENGHHVICCVRDPNRFNPPESIKPYVDIIKVDFLDAASLNEIPKDIDAPFHPNSLINIYYYILNYYITSLALASSTTSIPNKTNIL
jgi:uncharacterized protein YbjT (DUF2867 family)